MRDNRTANQIRDIDITPGYSRYAEGSALVHWGHTRILATVSLSDQLPPHMRGQELNHGWLTAEYSMLPRSGQERNRRERLYASGRTQEIQRLISRSLRSIFDLSMFPNKTVNVDVDVLQADGGTRCAGIVAGYAALYNASNKLIFQGHISDWPLKHEVAAVSLGIVKGETLIDLEFSEDVKADVDLNVIATANGDILEVQGGSEMTPISAETYVQLVATGTTAIKHILDIIRPQLS